MRSLATPRRQPADLTRLLRVLEESELRAAAVVVAAGEPVSRVHLLVVGRLRSTCDAPCAAGASPGKVDFLPIRVPAEPIAAQACRHRARQAGQPTRT